MPKFLYSPIPSTVLCNPELSPTMKLRYGILLGTAFNRQTLKKSLDEIGALWAEAEGEAIDAESVGGYLGKMVKAGLIRREQIDRYRWVTRLLHRYNKRIQTVRTTHAKTAHTTSHAHTTQERAESETPAPRGGLDSETPMPRKALTPASGGYLTNSVVDDEFSEDNQQQQLVNYLLGIGILQETAESLAQRVDIEDAVYWGEYAKRNKGLRNPAGFVVTKLGAGEEPPDIMLHICPLCRCSPCTCGFW